MIVPPLTTVQQSSITLFWFRRDLRLDDNHGLYQALSANNIVLPIFIFDTNHTIAIHSSLSVRPMRLLMHAHFSSPSHLSPAALGGRRALYHRKNTNLFSVSMIGGIFSGRRPVSPVAVWQRTTIDDRGRGKRKELSARWDCWDIILEYKVRSYSFLRPGTDNLSMKIEFNSS